MSWYLWMLIGIVVGVAVQPRLANKYAQAKGQTRVVSYRGPRSPRAVKGTDAA